MLYPIRILASLTFLAGSALAQGTGSSQPNSKGASPSVEARVKALHTLLDEQWEYTLRTSPEFASILGDKRYNDKLTDFSQAAIDRDLAQNKAGESARARVAHGYRRGASGVHLQPRSSGSGRCPSAR